MHVRSHSRTPLVDAREISVVEKVHGLEDVAKTPLDTLSHTRMVHWVEEGVTLEGMERAGWNSMGDEHGQGQSMESRSEELEIQVEDE